MISHPIEQTRAETAGLCRETVLEWKYLLDTDNLNERKGSRDRLKLQMVNPCQTYCEHPSICVISSSFPRMCTIRNILIMSEPSPNILACHLACPSYYWSLTNIEMQRGEGNGKVTHKGISQNKQKWHCFSHALIWNAKLKIWNIRFCKKKIPPEIILGKSHNLIHSLTHSCATNGLFSDILGILREISWSWYHDKRDNFPSSFDWKSTLGISHYSCHTFAFTQWGQLFFEVASATSIILRDEIKVRERT